MSQKHLEERITGYFDDITKNILDEKLTVNKPLKKFPFEKLKTKK